jgi:hypothetical protein
MIFQGLKVVFTNHAIERLKESQLDLKQGLTLLANSIPEDLSRFKDMVKYNNKKYDTKADNYRNGTFIFTCIKKYDNTRNCEILLVITVANQLITSKINPVLDKC